MTEDMTVHAANVIGERCTVRLVPMTSFSRLQKLAEDYGLSTATLPEEALPQGILTRRDEKNICVFLAGTTASIAAAKSAWADGDAQTFRAQLNLPACCLSHAWEAANGAVATYDGTVDLAATIPTHALLAPLGISVLPIEPCRFDCTLAIDAATQWLELAAARGYVSECGWLRECFSWAISWSELHGVTEVKTPLFRMCFERPSSGVRLIRRIGSGEAEGGAVGLTFPYAPPARQPRLVEIGVAP